MNNRQLLRFIKKVPLFLLCILIFFIWITPIIWLIYGSFQSTDAIAQSNFSSELTLDNYKEVFERTNVLDFFINSIIVASTATFFSALIGIPAAYSMARWNTGGMGLAFWILSSRMMPPAVSIIPFFLMYAFGISAEAATSMNGTLMAVIGVLIMISAFSGGWLADRIGSRRIVGFSGIFTGAGALLILGTVWMPNLTLIYIAGSFFGIGTGLFMTANWSLGTELIPAGEAGRYLGISNLAGAGAGMIGKGIGGPMADYLNGFRPGLGYFAIFAAYVLLFFLSTASLLGIRKAKA